MAACALSISTCRGACLAGSRPCMPNSFLRLSSVAQPLNARRKALGLMRLHFTVLYCDELSAHLVSMLGIMI